VTFFRFSQPHTSWAGSITSRRLNYGPNQTEKRTTRPGRAVDWVGWEQVSQVRQVRQRQLINYSNSIELGHVEQLEAGAATPEKCPGTCRGLEEWDSADWIEFGQGRNDFGISYSTVIKFSPKSLPANIRTVRAKQLRNRVESSWVLPGRQTGLDRRINGAHCLNGKLNNAPKVCTIDAISRNTDLEGLDEPLKNKA